MQILVISCRNEHSKRQYSGLLHDMEGVRDRNEEQRGKARRRTLAQDVEQDTQTCPLATRFWSDRTNSTN